MRRTISVVAADAAVFRGSLADNIRYQRPDATDAEVKEAALAAGLGRALERLPEGLATEVGEHGVGLSVGERQRLQLARALCARPPHPGARRGDGEPRLRHRGGGAVGACHDGHRAHVTGRGAPLLDGARRRPRPRADGDGRIVEDGTPAALVAAGGWFARFAASSTPEGDEDSAASGAKATEQEVPA